jgi:predicted transcriptional regulator
MTSNASGPHEQTQFLSLSRGRVRLLRCLDETSRCPRELTEVLGLSRRGVQRNLSALVDRGWVEKVSGKYRLTTSGALITRQYVDFCNTLSIIDECKPFFRYLPCAHVPRPEWLTDAEVVVATAKQPHAPIEQYATSLRTCSTATVRSILPVLSRYYSDIHTDIQDRGIETEFIIDETTLKTVRTRPLDEFEAGLHLDTHSLYEYPEMIEFGLTLTDHCGVMNAYDEQGRIQACIECEDSAFLDWANGLYQSYRDGAHPVRSAE